MPFSTRYAVSIDRTATAVSGQTLADAYTFSFTTPTVKLLATNWYRRTDRYDSPLVVGFRFNQPVRAADLRGHLALTYESHDWKRPELSAGARARLASIDPPALQAFEAKVAAADAAASSTAAVPAITAGEWDVKRLGAADPTLIVLQTTTVPPPKAGFASRCRRGHQACRAAPRRRAHRRTPCSSSRPSSWMARHAPPDAIPTGGTRSASGARP